MAIIPNPALCELCGSGGGSGAAGSDVESLLLCDVNADGEVVGTALAVYEYDSDGNPVGAPTFVIPGTNTPYVVVGTLQACPGEIGCGAPQQFCFTSSETTDAPGRMYDLTLELGQGFAVTGIINDLTLAPTNVLWSVNDATGQEFADDLAVAIQSQFPNATVDVSLGADNRCVDGTRDFNIHIECLRLDQDPPTLLQLQYNGGRDLIINPAYAEPVPLDPPVNQGNYGFHLLARQDDPGPFPGNQPSGVVNCTNTANRGWETNDVGRTFEIWGQDVAGGQNTTPTPRGTPVQEISSDGPPAGKLNTIWQTFVVPAAGNFNIRVVHGARDAGETHRITLSTGDTDDNQVGDLIDNTTNPPSVTSSGGPNPWTTFNQVINLGPGTYTLAISTTNPAGGARGGLFTDMRVFVDIPGEVDDFTNNDDTCTVEVTSSNTTCEFWAPRCTNGTITHWYNVADGEELTNAAFWAQVPAPQCCTSDSSGGGDAVLGNLIHTYLVCGQTDTGQRTLSRVVITDQNGAAVSEQFYDTNGVLVTPSSWQPGACAQQVNVDRTLGPVCYVDNPPTGITRHGFQSLDPNDNPVLYTLGGAVVPVGTFSIVICPVDEVDHEILCDYGNIGLDGTPHQFVRVYEFSNINGLSDTLYDFELDGQTDYVVVGPVGLCGREFDAIQQVLCDADGVQFLRTYTVDNGTAAVINFTDSELDGITTFVPAAPVGLCDLDVDVTEERDRLIEPMCDSDGGGTPFFRHWQVLNDSGALVPVGDTELDGTTAYAPVGTVTAGACPAAVTVTTERDVEVQVLCDNNGPFFRRTVFNAADGTVVSTTDVNLDGTARVVAGPVGVCNADREAACWTTTAGGTTVFTGTIRHDDRLTGATTPGWALFNQNQTFVPANTPGLTFVQCGAASTVENPITIRSQHLNVVPGSPWTPASATGTILSVSYTVLSGTATVADHNGTSITLIPSGFAASWSVDEDQDVLTAPQSIASVGGRILVVWTERN